MSDHHTHHPDKSYFSFEKQEVVIEGIKTDGFILDIGGGGEGVIGHLKSDKVISIDPSHQELKEAPVGPLKVIMDACDLKFPDDIFGAATAFFSLMYIDSFDHPRVFGETHRVLKEGGRFFIWDVIVPKQTERKYDKFIIPIIITLPDKQIETAYGATWPAIDLTPEYYIDLLEQSGFELADSSQTDRLFYLEFKKI